MKVNIYLREIMLTVLIKILEVRAWLQIKIKRMLKINMVIIDNLRKN